MLIQGKEKSVLQN